MRGGSRRREPRLAGRDDDAAADSVDEARRLAVGVRGDDDRARDREDPVQAARDDVAGEPACEADDVHVRRRQRLRERLARLVREEADAVGAELARERLELGAAHAVADDRDRDVVEHRRRADQRVEVLRVADVPGVHDDEAVVEAVPPRPLVALVAPA